MESLLFFKPYHSGSAGGDRTWIHPSGRFAAVLDGVSGCRDAHAAAERCLNFLRDSDPAQLMTLPLADILSRMHADLIGVANGLMCVAGLVRYQVETVQVAWVGNPRLYTVGEKALDCLFGPPQLQPLKLLGMPEDFSVEELEFPLDSRCSYLLCSDGLDHERLTGSHQPIRAARTDSAWREVGERTAREEDWAFLTFPVERTISFIDPEWPCNPFVGPQEEYLHEKAGLAEIASVLFKEVDFDGFRIVGGITITKANSTRRPDGVLVSPYGVVLLELKDHDTSVTLYDGKRSAMLVRTWDGKERNETNPIEKVKEMLPSFGSYRLTEPPQAPVRTELRKIGAVVFTNPRAEVTCISGAGEQSTLPFKAGDVLVVTPSQFPGILREFAREVTRKQGPFLDRETIEAICTNLSINQEKGEESSAHLEVGKFLIEPEAVAEESTPYFQLHRGRFRNRDKRVLAKRFPLNAMGRDSGKEEMERLGREAYAINNLLERVPGIQHCHGSEQEHDCLYVVLEDVDGPRLPEWLDGNPGREERLSLLCSLAGTLAELAAEKIVHRAVYPSNIRVRMPGGEPVLTNFELCRLEEVATLPMVGRRLLDAKFIPEEINTPGRPVSPGSDVYSFAKIACFVLSPDRSLPFATYMEQASFVRVKGWDKLAASLGLPAQAAEELKRMMSNNPEKRPVGEELVEIVGGWR